MENVFILAAIGRAGNADVRFKCKKVHITQPLMIAFFNVDAVFLASNDRLFDNGLCPFVFHVCFLFCLSSGHF